jgi:hypothetical protein
MELFDAALDLKDRFARIRIEGQGKNALDFHIAFYMGELLQKEATTKCIVLSKDKGFDPLVNHLIGRGFDVSRVATLEEANKGLETATKAIKTTAKGVKNKPAPTASRLTPPADPFGEVVKWIEGIDKKKRPRKRKGLVAHIYNHFSKKIPEETVQGFVDQLIVEKRISETNGAIAYNC